MKEKELKVLKIHSFLDFCIRCEEIYEFFWEEFTPNFNIGIYRDYLLDEVVFSENEEKQRALAGICWEFLMGDIDRIQLYDILASKRLGKDAFKKNRTL